jgi:proline racemase
MIYLMQIEVISAHAEGEVGDVIIGGVDPIPGQSIWEQSRFIANDQNLRKFILNEPRGGVFRHVNLLVKPTDPVADLAFIIMEPEDTPPMSGSNSICVATVVLEIGIVKMVEPVTELVMQAPGGLVYATAKCKDGKVTQVRVKNVASFAGLLNQKLEVAGLGTLTVDTAFGGDSFVIVDSTQLGFAIKPDEAADLAKIGMKITASANEQLHFVHPTNSDWRHFSFTQIAKPIFYECGIAISKNAVAIQPGKIDRSPTGTGCSARLALLHRRGELKVGDKMIGRSIIDSQFRCKIEDEVLIGGKNGIIPSVAGQAWLTGRHIHTLDPTDPWPLGYKLSDTWPNKL